MIRIALNHKTTYHYDRSVGLGPQVIRLRPAPHCRTPICSYSLRVKPDNHFINWQQDPHGNYLARLNFPESTESLEVEVDLVAEMTVINPFDFFLEPSAEQFPFQYSNELSQELKPYLETIHPGPKLLELLDSIDSEPCNTNDFLVAVNQRLEREIDYLIRMEPGVQTPEETLTKRSGSCRDSAWLLVQLLRFKGLAARFASGYLVQLKPDVKPLDGPGGSESDFTDLHAWAEVFLPGAGWVGLDPTSGLLAGEGHIPVACTPNPSSASPISGTLGDCEVTFGHEMSITRIEESPRVTKPYTADEWQAINEVGQQIDHRLEKENVRLTMGGEPTFVSIDHPANDEWNTAAQGPTKRGLAHQLTDRLRTRFAEGGLLHCSQGKWYPGEPLPRWAFTCLWRTDGQPIWNDVELLANPNKDYGHTIEDATSFSKAFAARLELDADHLSMAYEDALYYLWKEQRLPVNEDLKSKPLEDDIDRARLAQVLTRGLNHPTGIALPLYFQTWGVSPGWRSAAWPVRSEQMFLIPGDSPMGLRLPLDSLPPVGDFSVSPFSPFDEQEAQSVAGERIRPQYALHRANDWSNDHVNEQRLDRVSRVGSANAGTGVLHDPLTVAEPPNRDNTGRPQLDDSDAEQGGIQHTIHTAMCFEARNGRLHVFMPPVHTLDNYLELVSALEATAKELEMPIVVEGYLPPNDFRAQLFKVTPDPGVIEVNVHPAKNWSELVAITSGVYEDARQTRLGTDKFDQDGTHTGTGGGSHIVMGGATPADSPFLRRPDLLRSLIGYWHNHPALSYLFSTRFIGPTSQSPRVDEGRRDAVYEMQTAFEQIPPHGQCPPWLVDRVFRHLLVDLSGNTHRAEICIDKLYSPDSSTGRLGLVELRAFEMPPHWQMNLAQQLLLRALVAHFWETPYTAPLVDWGTQIHDRWMLPHFIQSDIADIVDDLNTAGFDVNTSWFEPHFEFRFPYVGSLELQGIQVELRTAGEPWYVLGEEPAGGATSRYVDSSVERIQIKVSGMCNERHVITCNGRKVPLHPTGTEGEFVGAVRYRAWQPPSCLHPTITVDDPLVFDVHDLWKNRSVGGCKYYVGHPGGRNSDTFPVNAFEAESRRAARFVNHGYTGGKMETPRTEPNERFPMTLDLRRNRKS